VSQIPISVGTNAMDATGAPYAPRLPFIACNSMIAELYGLAGLQNPPSINVGTYAVGADPANISNTAILAGETCASAFNKINIAFSVLFSAVSSSLQEVINLGGGAGTGQIIGTGDPARVAFVKINNNFTYLYTVL
jgi:hypothetical protein